MANAWGDLNEDADSWFRSKSRCSSFEQEADLGLSAILGSDRGPRQFFEEIALAGPFFICVLKNLQLRFVQRPSSVQVIIVNCFKIGQKNWSSICQACVFEIAQKWNADRAANSPLLFVQQWKREFVQRNYKNGIWLGRLKMVLPVPSVKKVQPLYDIWQAEKSKAGSDKR